MAETEVQDARQKVQLETAEGQLLGTSDISQSKHPPTVIVWGDRVFKWVQDLKQPPPSERPLIYREVSLVFVLEHLEPPANANSES